MKEDHICGILLFTLEHILKNNLMTFPLPVVCSSLNTSFTSPGWNTPNVTVTWQNEAINDVSFYFLHADGMERFVFTLPVAARKNVTAMKEYVWVARDVETHKLLPLQGQCSYVIPEIDYPNPVQVIVTNDLQDNPTYTVQY